MLPVLFDLRFLKIYTFGVFAALAFVWGLFVLWKYVKLTSYKEEDVFDSVFVSIFIALISSRLVFVILNFEKFGLDILKIILINGYPGMSLVGFLFGLFISLYLAFSKLGIEFKKIVDYIATPILVSLSFGKLGSFLSGVDVGTKTKFPIAVHYVGYGGIRHITAFYEAVLLLLSAVVARRILFAIRRGSMPVSANFFWFIFSFGGILAVLDKLKDNRLYFGSFLLNLTVGTILCVVGAVYFVFINRQNLVLKVNQLFIKASNLKKNYDNKRATSKSPKKAK